MTRDRLVQISEHIVVGAICVAGAIVVGTAAGTLMGVVAVLVTGGAP